MYGCVRHYEKCKVIDDRALVQHNLAKNCECNGKKMQAGGMGVKKHIVHGRINW